MKRVYEISFEGWCKKSTLNKETQKTHHKNYSNKKMDVVKLKERKNIP